MMHFKIFLTSCSTTVHGRVEKKKYWHVMQKIGPRIEDRHIPLLDDWEVTQYSTTKLRLHLSLQVIILIQGLNTILK